MRSRRRTTSSCAAPRPAAEPMSTSHIDTASLTAFDVHVHLEHAGDLSATDAQAAKYFKGSASRDPEALAEYYRSRKMACVVFTVEEKLTGRPHLTNQQVADFASTHADIALAFASLNPHRGADAVREARELVASGTIRGLKLHPPIQEFYPNDRLAYPLYEVF